MSGNRGLWVGLAVGVPIMAYGVAGALADSSLTHPIELTVWVVGSGAVHDLVLVPVVLAVGWLVGRRLPAPLRWALATSALLVAIAWPLVRGYGRNPNIPSLLPRNYGAGLLAYLAAVWAAALAVWLVERVRARPR